MIGMLTFVVESDSADLQRHIGTEVVRSLDGAWIIGEARGAEPGDKEDASVLLLGFDPEKERFEQFPCPSNRVSLQLALNNRRLRGERHGPANPGLRARSREPGRVVGAPDRPLGGRVELQSC